MFWIIVYGIYGWGFIKKTFCLLVVGLWFWHFYPTHTHTPYTWKKILWTPMLVLFILMHSLHPYAHKIFHPFKGSLTFMYVVSHRLGEHNMQ